MQLSLFFRRFMRTKLGTLFLLIVSIAFGLFLVNFLSAAYSRVRGSSSGVAINDDGQSFGGRELAGVRGHGGPFLRRKGHRRDSARGSAQVCKVPRLTLDDDANRHAYHPMKPLQCTGKNLFYLQNGSLRVNNTVLGGNSIKKCHFRAIDWLTDSEHVYSKTYVRTKKPFTISVKHDFFRVECFLNKVSNGALNYKARSLLGLDEDDKEGDLVEEGEMNAPKLVGAFGMPDIPNDVLSNHAVKHQEAVVKRGLEDMMNQNDGGVHIGPDKADRSMIKRHLSNEVLADDAEIDAHVDEDDKAGEQLGDDTQESNLDEYDQNYSEYPGGVLPDFDQFVAQVFLKEEVEERLSDLKSRVNSLGIDVLIISLDSMSHLSYQRKLPRTYGFLKDTLNSVIMDGYNVVGDSTTAAMFPLLTGHAETELPEARIHRAGSHYVDIFPFIWNKYEQNGYVTLFAEDQPHLGTFQRNHNGFEQPPVDHYMRPFWQAALVSKLREQSTNHCIGPDPIHKYTLDYVKQFYMRYQKFPKFMLAFLGELSHSDNNPAEYLDLDLLDFLQSLRERDVFENTLLIVMSDHGPQFSTVRATAQGKLEERLPFMSLHFPQWFQDKYPSLHQNLKKNRKMLTTPFDVYETLRDLIDIKRAELPVHANERGISLLKQIPLNRTCQSAGIDLHWCTCMETEEVEITDARVQKAAAQMVNFINQETSRIREYCEELRLIDIKNASLLLPNEELQKNAKSRRRGHSVSKQPSTNDLDMISLQVTIETAPNNGLYEGTVQLKNKDGSQSKLNDISRINNYKGQASCVVRSHPDLRKYCFCKQA